MDIFSRPVAECDADKEVKKSYWRRMFHKEVVPNQTQYLLGIKYTCICT